MIGTNGEKKRKTISVVLHFLLDLHIPKMLSMGMEP